MRDIAKSEILASKIEREDWTHKKVSEMLNCSRSTVSKAVSGEEVGEWFWKEAAAKLGCYELSRYLLDKKFAELISLEQALWEQTEKAPAGTDAVALS